MIVKKVRLILGVAVVSAAGSIADKAWAGDLIAGKAKAEQACQVCHGIDGIALIPMAANLSGQQKDYIIAQLEDYRSGKRHHEQMKIIAEALSDDDIENVAEWYSSIKVTLELPD